MPLAGGANYSIGSIINAGCGVNGGIVEVTNVSTDANTTLGYTVTDLGGNQVGAYMFGNETQNGAVTFDNLPDGNIYIEISASSGQTHFWNTTIVCGGGVPDPGCDVITGVTENGNEITVVIGNTDTKIKRFSLNHQ